MHVSAIGVQVDDRIADDLAGPVVGDVSATTGLEHLDAASGERFRCGQDVRPSTITLHPEGETGGCSTSKSRSGTRSARRSSTRARCRASASRIGNDTEPPRFEQSHDRRDGAPAYQCRHACGPEL